MKRIFYIANVRLPTEKAHGIQIMKMCEAFARAGVFVELIVPRRFNPLKTDPFEYYGVERNFKITRLPILDTVSCGRIGFLFETLLFLFLARLYIFGKSGIVYTREEAAGLFFSNFVLELHTLPNTHFLLPRILFVLTNLLKQQLVANGVDEKKICVLPDAVDFAQFDISLSKEAARQKLGLPNDKKIVMYAGSFFLYDWKGVDILIEAARAFHDNTLFVLVGGKGKDTKNVLFVGYRPPTEIPLYLKAADVLVLPNKKGSDMSEKHTSPLKLFEYMASGRPIVSSDLPSIREVITEKHAFFFKPDDPTDLAQVIRDALKPEAEERARAAVERVLEFSWDRRANNVLAYING